MTLRLIDGFDHYATADLLQKWDYTNGTVINTTLANTRWGAGQSIYNSNNSQIYLAKNLPGAATYIVGQAVNMSGIGYYDIVAWYDQGTIQGWVRVNAAGDLTIYRWAGGSNVVIGTAPIGTLRTNGRWQYVEIKCTISATVGVLEIRVDGNPTPVLSLTGLNNMSSANATINLIRLGWSGISGNSGGVAYVDDVYILDTSGAVNNNFLGDVRVYTLMPTGAGNYTQWTRGGSGNPATNWQAVSEASQDGDVSYVATNVVGNMDTYVVADLPAAAATIFAVQPNLYARKDDAGSRQVQLVQRNITVDYFGTAQYVVGSYAPMRQILETSVATAAAWTPSEINTSEFGVRVAA